MSERLILVDGTARTRLALKARLSAACYQVEAVSDLAQLSECLSIGPRALVLLASELDGLDLGSLCRIVTNIEPSHDVIAIAAPAQRVDLIRAGAMFVLSPGTMDRTLFAALRAYGRRRGRHGAGTIQEVLGMAEGGAGFRHRSRARVTLIADNAKRAMLWQRHLQAELPHEVIIASPLQALQEAAAHRASDLYLIAAGENDASLGLDLIAELRAREPSRHAAYILSCADDDTLQAIALDLGVQDFLPLDLAATTVPALASSVIGQQLAEKAHADADRADEARQMRLAHTDHLTGLGNRHHAAKELRRLASDAICNGTTLGLLMIDLDRFKACNDAHGHPAGDAVLKAIGARLTAIVGHPDIALRVGGDEFQVLMPGTSPERAAMLAASIAHALSDRPIELPAFSHARQTRLTASIGVAVCTAEGCASAEMLMDFLRESADRAERMAKRGGGNRVEIADIHMQLPFYRPRPAVQGLELSEPRT